MTIQWTPDLAMGIASIDRQHQRMIQEIATLVRALNEGRTLAVGPALDFLDQYVLEHFSNEEMHMKRVLYPGIAVHRAAHAAFVEEFSFLKRSHREKGLSPALVLNLRTWLFGWLVNHIREMDMSLGRFLLQGKAQRSRLQAAASPSPGAR
ncbi:MAG: hemerythrin family protein [Deltaproteobacteria bacterium]|nr:hemerythrin family protein [Deltaproteobacteria bacterium]